MASVSRLRLLPRRPAVDARERAAHELGLVAMRDALRYAEGVDTLSVSEEFHRTRPIRAPHASVDPECVDDAADWIPDVPVGEGLV